MTFLTPIVTQQTKEAEVDRSPLKIAALGVLGALAAFFSVYRFTEFLSSMTGWNALIAGGAITVFFIAILLQAFFVKSAWKLFFIALLEVVAASGVLWDQFYPVPSYTLLAAMAGFLALLFFGMYEGSRFLREALSIRFAFVSRGVFARAVSGFLIFLAAVSYVWFFDLGKFNPENGYRILEASIASAEPVLRVQFPGASLNQTAEAFFRKVAESELRKLPKPQVKGGSADENVDFNILNKQQQELLIQGTAETLRASFERSLGVPIPKKALLKDILFSYMKMKIENFSKQTSYYFGIIVALAVFFTLKGFFMLVGWVIRFFAFVAYKILVMFGFAYIGVETRNREFILLS